MRRWPFAAAVLLIAAVVRAEPASLPAGWSQEPAPPFAVQAAACSRALVFGRDYAGRVASFDGRRWRELPQVKAEQGGHGIAVSPAGDVYLELGSEIGHWDGERWSRIPLADWRGSRNGMVALGSGALLVLGQGRLGRVVEGAVRSRDAGTWRDIFAASGASLSDLWIGGQGGTVLHHTERGWARIPTGVTCDITGLTLLGPTLGFAWCESSGTNLLRWNGTSFTSVATGLPGTPGHVVALAGVPWAISGRYVARFDGQAWVVELEQRHLSEEYSSFWRPCATESFLYVGSTSNRKQSFVRRP